MDSFIYLQTFINMYYPVLLKIKLQVLCIHFFIIHSNIKFKTKMVLEKYFLEN